VWKKAYRCAGYNRPIIVRSPEVSKERGIPAQGKTPFIAAFLNLFFGLGYLYLGYSKVVGVPTIIFIILAIIAYLLTGWFTYGIVTVIIAILFAIDGFEKADGQRGFVSAE